MCSFKANVTADLSVDVTDGHLVESEMGSVDALQLLVGEEGGVVQRRVDR